MIEIEKAERWRHCNCCYSKNEVREFRFISGNHGITVALCADCIEELHAKMDGDGNG